jgi:hypothetical protein
MRVGVLQVHESGGDVALKRVRKRCVDGGGGEIGQGGTLRCHGAGGSHLVWLMSSPQLDLSVSWIWVLLSQAGWVVVDMIDGSQS